MECCFVLLNNISPCQKKDKQQAVCVKNLVKLKKNKPKYVENINEETKKIRKLRKKKKWRNE